MNDPGMINGEAPRPRTGAVDSHSNNNNNNNSYNNRSSSSFSWNESTTSPTPTAATMTAVNNDATLRSLSMDDAISLLRDRQRATETLNHLLQKELNDHRLAESYQAFRARYLRALNKLHPAVYEEPEFLTGQPSRRIRSHLQTLRTDEHAKKVRCRRLQDAWAFYDSVATDKPEVLSAEDQKVEGQMDEIEESVMQEWQDFASDVVTRAGEWGEGDAPYARDWGADAERFAAELRTLQQRKVERDEFRKKAELRRMHQIMRARRGGNGDSSSADLDYYHSNGNDNDGGVSSDEDEQSQDGTAKKSLRSSARSKKKKKDRKKDKKKDKETSSPSSEDAQPATTIQLPSEENRLLDEVFPPHIAQALREGRKVEPEERPMVTIFFSDIVGFTNISSVISPLKVSQMLDRLYHKFDSLSRKHDVFKVETIGDSWMGVTNLVKDQPDHAIRVAKFAIDALTAAQETNIDDDDPSLGKLNLRVGFHSGPVVASVVGSRNPRYCLFGDTVNTASRMESHSKHGRIQCSDSAADFLRDAEGVYLISRGQIDIKGKGLMETFFVQDQEEDQEVRMATEMAMMAAKYPHLKPPELRALAERKLEEEDEADDGPPGLVPAGGPPSLVSASGSKNGKEQHPDDRKSGSGFKFWKRETGEDKSRKKGGILNKVVGFGGAAGGKHRPENRRASMEHIDRSAPPTAESRRASLDHRAVANAHRRPSSGVSRRPSGASHASHGGSVVSNNRRQSGGGRLDGVRIMRKPGTPASDRRSPGRTQSLDGFGVQRPVPKTSTEASDAATSAPVQPSKPERLPTPEPDATPKKEQETSPRKQHDPTHKVKSTTKTKSDQKQHKSAQTKSKSSAPAAAATAPPTSSRDMSHINKFLAKSVEALEAPKLSAEDAVKVINEIYDMVKASDKLQAEFGSVDGIQLFTDIVKRFEKKEPVLEAAFRLESVLAETEGNRDDLVKHGNIEFLLKAMKKHTVNAVIEQWAAHSLATLANSKEHQDAIVAKDGLEVIMATQKEMTAHGAVQVACFRALRALATHHQDNAFNIAANGGIWAIMGVLQSKTFPLATVIDLHVEAFSAMAELARESDSNRGSLAAAGAIPKVIGAVTCFLKNANLTEAGIDALYCMSIEHTSNCDTIVAYDGMKSVISFMKKHKNHKGTQEKGVLLLATLIEQSNTAQFRIPDELRESVEHALSKNPDDEKLQDMGKELLDGL